MFNINQQPFVFLSRQGRDGESAGIAPEAAGVLVGPDTVVFPALAPDLLDEVRRGQVVVVAADGGAVERIGVALIEAHAVEGEGSVAVVARLAVPTELRPPLRSKVRGDQVLDALLAELDRPVPPSLLDASRDALQRQPERASVRVHANRDEVSFSICNWIPGCHPIEPTIDP